MTRRRLNQYKGMLSPAQAAAGMNAARRNAIRLASDARTLLEGGRLPTAVALAVLAVEEAGKISILRAVALARDEKEAGETWKEYRSHIKKNIAWILPQLVAKGAWTLEDLRPLVDDKADHPQVLDQIKQIAMYTDCLGDGRWSVPEEVIESPVAAALVSIAEIFSSGAEVTVKEMELWVKHLAPVWKRDMRGMKTALTNWRRDMVEFGLANTEGDSFHEFVWGDPAGV